MAIDVQIDRDACMGSGNCLYHAAGGFDLDDDGIAMVVDVEAVPLEKIVEAAKHCPTGAISVHEGGVELA